MRIPTIPLLAAALCAAPAFAQFDANGNAPWPGTGVGTGAPGAVLNTLNGPYYPSSGVGHDGTNLLVISAYDGLAQIYIVDDATGATLGTVPIDSSGDFGLTWDSTRQLYVTTTAGGYVKTFDGVSPYSVSTFNVGGGLVGAAYDASRDVYWVCDWRTDLLHAVSASSGSITLTYSTASVGCTRPAGVGYDAANDIVYVGGRDQSSIFGIDAATGSLVCSFAAQDGGNNPQGLAGTARATVWHSSWNSNRLYELEGCAGAGFTLSASGTCPGPMTFSASGATPSGTVAFVWGLSGTFSIPGGKPCAGTVLDLVPLLTPAPGYLLAGANANGDVSIQAIVPAGACGTVLVQAVDLASCTTSNTVGL